MLKRTFIYIALLLMQVQIVGQDPQFSQFYSNPLYLSPSLAGGAEANRVTLNYRNQWHNLNAKFNTYNFSYDTYFQHFNSGIGIQAYKDVAGTSQLGKLFIRGLYSYNFKVYHNWRVRPGMSFGIVKFTIDNQALETIGDKMGDPTIAHDLYMLDGALDFDFGASLLIYSKNFWIGCTADHIINPNISIAADEERIYLKLQFYGGIELIRKGRLLRPVDETMTFAYLLRQQGTSTQLDLGVYWHKNPLVFGFWYRGLPPFNSQRGDAVIFLVGYKTKYFNIGYSYDLTISNLISHAIGSHEVSMSFKFLLPRRKKQGAVPCPDF